MPCFTPLPSLITPPPFTPVPCSPGDITDTDSIPQIRARVGGLSTPADSAWSRWNWTQWARWKTKDSPRLRGGTIPTTKAATRPWVIMLQVRPRAW
ncbi:hypothetical protein E2C01_065381 [Portunus trituberculatus]|uniref:Uncharacterized protein n=1 Tax=Portunus trituberculatus TaxID=210409 RepID=A0A5B7HIP3_PORTR|nr:hypothetical protein [Portunus trituberculatus]